VQLFAQESDKAPPEDEDGFSLNQRYPKPQNKGKERSIPKGPTLGNDKMGGSSFPKNEKICKSVHAKPKRILNLKNKKHHISLL
jgi:hypothetical protein